ncbi:DUF6193 family natural product biosynthesis protein [Streptomyces sp. NPDC048448]|uniref:DUF6193 family natural product biosynthesis protein n=1 Tax=Streptomyces sp. NPDC048448 TaxID=3365554 RepID=UPI00371E5C78
MAEETFVEKTWADAGGASHGATRRARSHRGRLRGTPPAGLVPFPSHGALAFHRNTQFPRSNDLPVIVGDAQSCIVYAPLSASPRVLGESLTPKEAAALVVAHLPDDCGPAIEGPWPPADSSADWNQPQSSSRRASQTSLRQVGLG